jgi:hypothetical protein
MSVPTTSDNQLSHGSVWLYVSLPARHPFALRLAAHPTIHPLPHPSCSSTTPTLCTPVDLSHRYRLPAITTDPDCDTLSRGIDFSPPPETANTNGEAQPPSTSIRVSRLDSRHSRSNSLAPSVTQRLFLHHVESQIPGGILRRCGAVSPAQRQRRFELSRPS